MSTSTDIPEPLPEDEPNDVLFNSIYGVRAIELNRPKKFNALNGSMVRKILPRLVVRDCPFEYVYLFCFSLRLGIYRLLNAFTLKKEYEKSQLANVIIVSGAGPKALCAGGDVAALALLNEKGPDGQRSSTEYFAEEYKLDHLIATYSKPYISVMDGVTMGGGVGLSVHAPFRIATERTLFAMPETSIGFFPEVGGSFFLPRLDGELGTYLALTSERLKGVQALYAGIATHYLDSSILGNLTARLSELVFNDTATLPERLDLVNKTIWEYSTGLPPEPITPGGAVRSAIDRCFKYNTIEEILEALKKETDQEEWAKKTLETLSLRSPTSLKVTLRQQRLGKKWSIAEAFRREHHIAGCFMRHPDFVQGVKSRLMTKPPVQAKWEPGSLSEVTADTVDSFLSIPDDAEHLSLLKDVDYNTYPHAKYALPSEKVIEKFVRDNSPSEEQIQAHFAQEWDNKEGVRQKVAEVLARRTNKTEQGLRWVD